jgi:hypothetical protein
MHITATTRDEPETTKPQNLDVMLPCYRPHANLLPLTIRGLRAHIPIASISVVARERDRPALEAHLEGDVRFIDADTLVPGMTLASLCKADLPYFPARAGWYFQQFCKLAFGLLDPARPRYLIWDADAVPLRP